MEFQKVDEKAIENLYKLIVSVNSIEDCKIFFDDLCTFKEVEQMALRIKAAQLLKEGKTFNQVIDEVNISSATLSRVSRSLKYGNGYKKFLK